MKKMKIVVIGAGSASFGSGVLADLLTSPELKEFALTVSLVDIDEKALDRMYRLALRMKEYCRSNVVFEASADRIKALPGADYVIVSVAQRRWDLWQKDFYIPLAFGFRHVFGENGGPGGAFHTLRSLNLVLPICRDMERFCPEALLLNFTNPESRVCQGVSMLTKIHSVGLCHGPQRTLTRISQLLEMRAEDIEITVGGINHFHWALAVRDRRDGRDLRAELDKKVPAFDWGVDNLTPVLHRLFGHITYPEPSHPGEYMGFAWEIAGPKYIDWGLGDVSRNPSAKAEDPDYQIEGLGNAVSYELWSLELPKHLDAFLEQNIPITPEFVRALDYPLPGPAGGKKQESGADPAALPLSGELTVPIICDIEFNRDRVEIGANVLNNGSIPNLPADGVVEVPIRVNAGGVKSAPVGPLPEAIAGMCAIQISIQKLLVQAYAEKSKRYLLQALLIDPIVDSVDRAEKYMETMLKAEADFLPELR